MSEFTATPPTRGPIQRSIAAVAAFLSDRSMFLLMLLLLEVGLLVGVMQAASELRALGVTPQTLTRGAAGSACADAAVMFQRNATEHDITLLLTQFGASIVYGPDENGAYLIKTPPGDMAAAALQAFRDSPAVSSARAERICR